jgi:hypothetical protein
MRGWAVGRSSRRAPRLAASCAAAICLIATSARAHPEYPGEVQTATGAECPPPCVVCHQLPTGGKNWNPFGLRVFPYSAAQRPWPQILAELRKVDIDSDLDGRLDIFELEHGTNPFQTGNDSIVCPRYGCGARVAPSLPSRPLLRISLLGGVVLALLARRRRQRVGSTDAP